MCNDPANLIRRDPSLDNMVNLGHCLRYQVKNIAKSDPEALHAFNCTPQKQFLCVTIGVRRQGQVRMKNLCLTCKSVRGWFFCTQHQ